MHADAIILYSMIILSTLAAPIAFTVIFAVASVILIL